MPTIEFAEEEAGAFFASDTNAALGEWHFEQLAGLEADPEFPSPGVARARLVSCCQSWPWGSLQTGQTRSNDLQSLLTCQAPSGGTLCCAPGPTLRASSLRTTCLTAERFNQLAVAGLVLIPRVCLIHSLLWLKWLRFLAGAQRGWPQVEL